MADERTSRGFVFERHEKKFLIEPEVYPQLQQALSPWMEQDQYGLHTISSLYYDTDDFAIIRHSLDKPAFKQKLRLRSYGTPGESDPVYLELKKKFRGVTYKRRMAMPLSHARDYLERGIVPPEGRGQTFGELDWFIRQHRPRAKVLISYDRIALAGRENPDFRVTFDMNVRWREEHLNLGRGDYGARLLRPGQRIMEVKTLDALPLWLCRALSDLEVYPCSYTKYGVVYREHFMDRQKEALRHVG